jgi:hypothetical protein
MPETAEKMMPPIPLLPWERVHVHAWLKMKITDKRHDSSSQIMRAGI